MNNNKIYLSPPHMSSNEKELLIEAFNSNWIAPTGPHINQFESDICKYLNINYACALSSGTAALHLALKVVGIQEGDTVLCPSFTFAATANAIMYEKAVPVFLDSNIDSWLVDIDILSKAIQRHKPKAFISVDLYGKSCDYEPILEICKKNNVILIEDAAEALGAEYQNKKCGTFGQMGIFSFNGNKIITTSSGGMLVSENEDHIKRAKFLSMQAREPEIHYEHKELGYNYRMSNILAAIGIEQLKKIDKFVSIRRNIYQNYHKSLSHIDGFTFLDEQENCKSNRWLSTLIVDPNKLRFDRSEIINRLAEENIESRPLWKPMHMQPFYRDFQYVTLENEDVSRKLFEEGICLPSGSSLKSSEQEKIIKIIKSLIL